MAAACALALFSGTIMFIICNSETTAVVSELLFHTEINFPNKGFPRKGQILPAPGRNVTAGDKEGSSCHRR